MPPQNGCAVLAEVLAGLVTLSNANGATWDRFSCRQILSNVWRPVDRVPGIDHCSLVRIIIISFIPIIDCFNSSSPERFVLYLQGLNKGERCGR